ncbi:MAG: hypothetical protein CEO12_486 [Parcubacteria group bacterium Gr01-1014_46]|nr:MAG: hypothetical protein CEO12_486 [Parcubacteria group bacterium Gr01-1014_46]
MKFENISEEQVVETEGSAEAPKLSRRHFLRILGRVGAGLTVTSLLTGSIAEAGEQTDKKLEKDKEAERVLRESWEDYKDLVEKGKVRENIEFIEKELGNNGVGIIFFAKSHLLTFDTLRDAEKSGKDIFNDPQYIDILKMAVSEYNDAWDRGGLRSRGEKSESPLQFEGFEKKPEINLDEFKSFLEQKYGKSWLLGTVDKIIYVDEEENRKTFGVAGAATGRGLTGSVVKTSDQFIYVYKSDENIQSLLAHELAHHNDWLSSHNLTVPERLEFLRNVIENRKRGDAPKYDYVERQTVEEGKANGNTEEDIKVAQITEFWAMICEAFFTNSAELYKDFPESYLLVSKWYQRINSK